MDYLPLFFDVKGKTCLIVGGGATAYRKAKLLVKAQARLLVVSPEISPELEKLLGQNDHQFRMGEFSDADLDGVVLAIAATDDKKLNQRISNLAHEKNIPVNVVDQPDMCSAIVPAVVDRSPVVVAISSGGASPVLLRQLKEQMETQLPGTLGQLANFLGGYREQAKQQLTDFKTRVRFWEAVLESSIPELIHSGNQREAEQLMAQQLADIGEGVSQGEVYLVGAGPGDPDLLTLRALRLIMKADVVLYDRLVSEQILQRVRPDAEQIHVGKQRKHHPVPQETINDMLVRLAKEGKRVLRLKGGDPFIFGRGGEEMASLMEHDIPFQVVPGITAASGCASYAGIPLTHRDYSHAVHFLTGHFTDKTEEPDWASLTGPKQTLVFYMGLVNVATICQQLAAHGLAADTPAALVQKGTTEAQSVITGELETLPDKVTTAGARAPTLIIVGEVVKLREKLGWFRPD